MKDKTTNIFESKDKQIVPYLLSLPEVQFLGTRLVGSMIYFRFSPADKCKLLVNDFLTRKAAPVDPKTLLEMVEVYRDRIFEMKEKNRYEGEKT